MDIRNPRTGKYDYKIKPLEQGEIKDLALAMRNKQKSWKEAGAAYRIEVLQKWKTAVEKQLPAIIDALTTDTGRRSESELEAKLLAASIDRWCGIAQEFFRQEPDKVASIPFIHIRQDLEPYPLVGVISPWNFPLLLSIIDTIPALLAGCAVMVKPSEVTPRFVDPIMESIRELPELEGILHYVQGAAITGAAMVGNCDLICFTGSVATGRKVYHAAAEHFIPVFLELGGKDPALVLKGANIDHASSSLLWGSVVNAGQSCLSIERIYVQEEVFEEFVEKISAKANALKLAYPETNSGQIGPIISEAQVKIINEHLRDALDQGAVLHSGSGVCENYGGGWYCFPTVLTNVHHGMKVMAEETFGPILPIMKFKSVAEGVQMANDSIYGLSGAVFAASREEAIKVAAQLTGGAISINDAGLTAMIHEGEKNAFKFSGIGGTRMGPTAIKRFMRQKAYLIKTQSIPSHWWFDV